MSQIGEKSQNCEKSPNKKFTQNDLFIPRQKQASTDDAWRLTLDLLMSLPVSLDSDLLTVFLDGGRWTELILGSVWLDDDVLFTYEHTVNKQKVFEYSCAKSTVHIVPSFTTTLDKPTLSYKERSNTE